MTSLLAIMSYLLSLLLPPNEAADWGTKPSNAGLSGLFLLSLFKTELFYVKPRLVSNLEPSFCLNLPRCALPISEDNQDSSCVVANIKYFSLKTDSLELGSLVLCEKHFGKCEDLTLNLQDSPGK